MYRRYYNEYERRAQEIRRAADLVEASPVKAPSEKPAAKPAALPFSIAKPKFLDGIRLDDILLGALIFFLLKEEETDKTLILALAFIFLSGF